MLILISNGCKCMQAMTAVFIAVTPVRRRVNMMLSLLKQALLANLLPDCTSSK